MRRKGKGGCYNRRPVKNCRFAPNRLSMSAHWRIFSRVGKRNVALNGVTAELRAYMGSGVS
jgi:hypothetical protein